MPVMPATVAAASWSLGTAANRIAAFPYRWGGGHRTFHDSGYDCSGSVSYVLHATGQLGRPRDSGELMSWGQPGRGRWITVYANAGHAFMTVAGLRFDTSGRNAGGSWNRQRARFVATTVTGMTNLPFGRSCGRLLRATTAGRAWF